MDTCELLMKYFMSVISGIAGGLTLLVAMDTQTLPFAKPFLIFFFLILGFFTYLAFAKSKEISKKRKDDKNLGHKRI